MKTVIVIVVVLFLLGFTSAALVIQPSSSAGMVTAVTPAQQQHTLSINSVEVVEGDQGTTNAVFTVTLSPPAFFTVRVGYATADNTAIAGSDYTPTSGTLTFSGEGNPTATISVPIIGDTLVEPPETFFVLLRNPTPSEYVGIGSGAGTCIIISNDSAPSGLYILNTDVDEGQTGDENAVFRVELRPPRIVDVSFDYTTQNSSAVAGSDYTARSGTITIPAGTGSVNIPVPIIDDTLPELTQQFFVKLSNARGAPIQDDEGVCAILDHDAPDSIVICSSDTPKESTDAGTVETRVTVDRDIIVNDLEARLFVTNLDNRSITVDGRLRSPVGLGDTELFSGLAVPAGFSIGTTCSPSPDFVITDNATRRIDQGAEAPYVGKWRVRTPLSSASRTLVGVNARGSWRLQLGSSDSSFRARKRLECFCLAVTGPREGLSLSPSTAVVPIGEEDTFGLGNPDDFDFGAYYVHATVNGSGGPVRNAMVTFTVRDQTGRALRFDDPFGSQYPTDDGGQAEFGYRNWVPGEHTIEARAEVNGAVYTDTARVSWVNPCAATATLLGTSDASSALDTMRTFRDSKLTKSDRGKQYTRLYYKFSSEAVRLMMFNPMMLLRSQQMIERYMPVLRDMTAGKEAVLTEGDLREMEDFMNYCGEKGSPELREILRGLCEDLRNPAVHEELGITITAGARREMPGRGQLQSFNRVSSWGMLIGAAGLVFYGVTGKRRRFLRRCRKQILHIIVAILLVACVSAPRKTWVRTLSACRPGYAPFNCSGGTLEACVPRHPFAFEANHGQADSPVKFVARGHDFNLSLAPAEAALQLPGKEPPSPDTSTNNQEPRLRNPKSAMLRMRLIGANPNARVTGLDPLPMRTNYFIGNHRSEWRGDVPSYARVKSDQVYKGVDLIYYGNGNQLEYDFIVAPGADPGSIRLGFEGSQRIEVDDAGDLVMQVGGSEVKQRKPFLYQEVNGARREIAGRYKLLGNRSSIKNPESNIQVVGFEVENYDPSLPLVIDPVLDYSTYLGGSGDDQSTAISLDPDGNIYIAGLTDSTDLTTINATQPNFGGGVQDAFVAKLDPSGTRLIYLTYLGGNDVDTTTGMATDSMGNVYVTGFTRSRNFPSLNAFQPNNRGQFNSFVFKLGPTGNLVYSTYLGGTANDSGSGVAVDSAGNAFVTGIATSANFPTVNPLQPNLSGASDVYVAKLNPSGNQLLYSTYAGGSQEDAATSIAVDPAGMVYVTGATLSTDFRTASANQPAHGGGIFDAFVAKLNPSSNQLVYSTYLGGGNADRGLRIAADSSGNAYVTGDTRSVNFPIANGFQRTPGGSSDAFVAKLNSNGSLAYSSYLGGSGLDGGTAIAVSANGTAFVTGFTDSLNFPTNGAVQAAYGGGSFDSFVARLNPSGSALEYSTYLGGSGTESGFGIAAAASTRAFILGLTSSVDFPTTNPLQSGNRGGTADLFVASISPGPGINSVMIQGKHLIVNGGGFVEGASILVNGDRKKTNYLSATSLRGKKVGKTIARGETVRIQVRNPDGLTSNEFSFMRP